MPPIAKYAYRLLLLIWTAIFAGFWGVVFLGGQLLEWLLTALFDVDAEPSIALINILQSVSMWGLLLIWVMGAVALYIAKRLIWAVMEGPGRPFEVRLSNDGHTIDGTATDKSELK